MGRWTRRPCSSILLSEYFRWSGDMDFLVEMKPHLRAAVDWLLEYGDLDGDGLIEYCRRSPKGLFNQGWKDSGDAIEHADGRIAQPPIALVEVQGYAVDAFARASSLFALLGSHATVRDIGRKNRRNCASGSMRRSGCLKRVSMRWPSTGTRNWSQ